MLCLLCGCCLLLGGCSKDKPVLKASDLADLNELSLSEILQTVALKTSEANPQGFVVSSIYRWPGAEQQVRVLLLSGNPFFEVKAMTSIEGGGFDWMNMLMIKDGKQKNINLSKLDNQWTAGAVFKRDPIYESQSQAAAISLLQIISAQSYKIFERYPDDLAIEKSESEDGYVVRWHVADEDALAQKLSKDPLLQKAGNTLGTRFEESLRFSKDGVLQSALYSNASSEMATMDVEISVHGVDDSRYRPYLDDLFSQDLQDGSECDVSWLADNLPE